MFYSNYKIFLDEIFSGLDKLQIDYSKMTMDHLAFQTATDEEYDSLAPELLKVADLVNEPIVDGRRVGVFKFHEALKYKDHTIAAIELIAPVQGKFPPSGLEHVELLLNESFEEFMAKYPNAGIDPADANREQFPFLKIRLNDHMRVKFPRYPILMPR